MSGHVRRERGANPQYAGPETEIKAMYRRVDVLDFSALAYWYGAERPCCSPAIYEQSTVDLDGDGTVGAADFTLLAANFGVSGEEIQP